MDLGFNRFMVANYVVPALASKHPKIRIGIGIRIVDGHVAWNEGYSKYYL